MKYKFVVFFCLFACIKVFSQNQLNVLITIDDVITASYNLSDGYIIIKKDTIFLEYEMGRFKIDKNDYERLKQENIKENIFLNFSYSMFCPEQSNYDYSLKLQLDLLLQNYLLIRVYNFSSYPKTFIKENGYGFEYISSLGSETLPKRKKMKRNPCE